MWSEAELGHLLLFGLFRMLETRYAWTLIMIKCLELALGRLEPWLWSFWYLLEMAWPYTSCMHLVSFWSLKLIMHIHLWWAQVLGLEWFKKKFWFSYQVEFNHRPLGLSSFITYKVQTIMMGTGVGLELSWFKQRPYTCVMQCNLYGPT